MASEIQLWFEVVACGVCVFLLLWRLLKFRSLGCKTMCIMTRTFHPVGQGAFYTEKFDFGKDSRGVELKLNVVYDCGSRSKGFEKKGARNAAVNAFGSKEQIDGVFISHFDNDHVNGFPELFKRVGHNVRHIFLPHLTDSDILLGLLSKNPSARAFDKEMACANAYRKLVMSGGVEDVLVRLGLDSKRENRPKVHLVLGANWQKGDERPRNFPANEIGVVDSGVDVAPILFDSKGSYGSFRGLWRFCPYNYEIEPSGRRGEFLNVLKDFLRANHLSFEKGVDTLLSSRDLLKSFKKCYCEKVSGEINENSMTLLSCANLPCMGEAAFNRYGVKALGPCCSKSRSGCLYTGDYDANGDERVNALFGAYASYVGRVGCVQLPHHGSDKNYNEKLGELDVVFVACYGKRNTFRHPGPQTMYHLGSKNRTVCLVSEDAKSKFIQEAYFSMRGCWRCLSTGCVK